MKAAVKLYKTDGSAKDGFYPVKLIIEHQKKRKRKTISYSRIEDWDERGQLPKVSHDDFENLYGFIMELRSKTRSMEFLNLEDVDAAMDFFDQKKDDQIDFYLFADQMVEKMRSLGRSGNADAYQCAVDQLKKYQPSLEFPEITGSFLEYFKQYKLMEGLKNTSISTYLYEIRAIYNKAVKLGICEDQRPFVGLFQDLHIQKRRLKNEYLDADGLRKLAAINGVSKEQQLAVDLSLLQFYLCGADLMDVYYLEKSQLAKNRVYLKRSKLGAKAYEFDVLVVPQAKAIIEKYMDPDDPVHVFPWPKDITRYKTFRSTHNTKLGRVQRNAGIELQPRGGKLTTKVLRHSFATMAKFQNIDVDIIRELMGHERSDIDTVYKDKFPESVRNKSQFEILFSIFGGSKTK